MTASDEEKPSGMYKRIVARRLYLTSRLGQRGKESNGGGSHVETASCGYSCQVYVLAYTLSKEFGARHKFTKYTEFAT